MFSVHVLRHISNVCLKDNALIGTPVWHLGPKQKKMSLVSVHCVCCVQCKGSVTEAYISQEICQASSDVPQLCKCARVTPATWDPSFRLLWQKAHKLKSDNSQLMQTLPPQEMYKTRSQQKQETTAGSEMCSHAVSNRSICWLQASFQPPILRLYQSNWQQEPGYVLM